MAHAGRWRIAVVVGLAAVLGGSSPAPSPRLGGKTRTYYIAADEVVWDYAPSGLNQVSGEAFDATERGYVEAGPHTLGRLALKALYHEYTDSTFAARKPRPPEWAHLGILGPLLRAEVGDTIRVGFKNNTRFPVTMHPHGVRYDKESEGAPYSDHSRSGDPAGGAVRPGGVHRYVWPVPESAGPASGDASSILWMYHSHVREGQDISSGLLGPILISARGTTRADGTPKDVDREFVAAFYEVNESASRYRGANTQSYAKDAAGTPVDTIFGLPAVAPPPIGQFNLKATVNGFLYGNGPMMTMRVGERVRWYLMAGTGFEIHTPHWHGNTVEIGHMRTDVATLLPMQMVVADMVAGNPGVWLFHCHVANHMRMGMQTRYEVTR